MSDVSYFNFQECSIVLKSTGLKAGTIEEMRDLLRRVSDNCIYHHTFQYFFKGNILEYTNDFAQWAGEAIGERELSERLSNVDPYVLPSLKELREELVRIIDDFLSTFPTPRAALQGDELFFNESVTIIYPLGIRARNLAEFLMVIRYIDPGSLYYHFYEARKRLGGIDDFSMWMEHSLGMKETAERIRAIDPFMHNIESIRQHIIDELEEAVRTDMEVDE